MISLVIPTLNEEEGISYVLRAVPDVVDEVVVVDGGSRDGTMEKVREMGVTVVIEEGGKADGIRRGLEETEGELVFFVDGDGSYPVERIGDMVEMDGWDMVLGSRFLGVIEEGAMSRLNCVGNKMLTFMANVLYGTDVSDVCTGLRGVRREILNDVPGKGFEVEAGIHSVMSSGEIEEVGIRYKKRKGDSKLRFWDGLKIGKRLLVERFKG